MKDVIKLFIGICTFEVIKNMVREYNNPTLLYLFISIHAHKEQVLRIITYWKKGERRLTLREVFRLQGFPDIYRIGS